MALIIYGTPVMLLKITRINLGQILTRVVIVSYAGDFTFVKGYGVELV